MGGIFSPPKPPPMPVMPAPAPLPAPPPAAATMADPAVQQQADRQRKAAQSARGRSSTILTSEFGAISQERPRLLGGV
jgi:hypothetical protein